MMLTLDNDKPAELLTAADYTFCNCITITLGFPLSVCHNHLLSLILNLVKGTVLALKSLQTMCFYNA